MWTLALKHDNYQEFNFHILRGLIKMLNQNQKKQIGRDFIKRLQSECKDIKAFKATLKEFASDSFENRTNVAFGLLAIGADRSERTFDRNFALNQLGMIIRTCGLVKSTDMETGLSEIIDGWIYVQPDHGHLNEEHRQSVLNSRTPPNGALLALVAVNRQLGLQKFDDIIAQYGESETGRGLRQLRDKLGHLNPSDGDP